MLVTLVAFLLVKSFNCEDLTCRQFFQNERSETVQATTTDCQGENMKCIRVEGQGLQLVNGTVCEFFCLYIQGLFYKRFKCLIEIFFLVLLNFSKLLHFLVFVKV